MEPQRNVGKLKASEEAEAVCFDGVLVATLTIRKKLDYFSEPELLPSKGKSLCMETPRKWAGAPT